MKAERQDSLARQSPYTIAAREEYERLKAEDEAAGYDCRQDPDHPLYESPEPPEDPYRLGLPDPALPPPGWGERQEPKEEAETWPKVRSVKDGGWG